MSLYGVFSISNNRSILLLIILVSETITSYSILITFIEDLIFII